MGTFSDSANSSLVAFLDGARILDILRSALEQTLWEAGKTPTTPAMA